MDIKTELKKLNEVELEPIKDEAEYIGDGTYLLSSEQKMYISGFFDIDNEGDFIDFVNARVTITKSKPEFVNVSPEDIELYPYAMFLNGTFYELLSKEFAEMILNYGNDKAIKLVELL